MVTKETKQDLENPWGSKYDPKMCLEIIQMFSDGKTRSAFCAHHTICEDTFEKWRKRHKIFDRACIVAHEKARYYYDDLRQRNLIQEKDGESIHWPMFNRMYNVRFNLADKRKVKVKGLGNAKNEKSMLKSLTDAVANGELTPDEASKLAGLIDISLKIKQVQDLEIRMDAIETFQKKV